MVEYELLGIYMHLDSYDYEGIMVIWPLLA